MAKTQTIKQVKTITDLRDNLAEVFTSLRNGKSEIEEAEVLANVAGKMITSARTQIEYSLARNEKPNIPFLK
jgi:hypothetical protein